MDKDAKVIFGVVSIICLLLIGYIVYLNWPEDTKRVDRLELLKQGLIEEI